MPSKDLNAFRLRMGQGHEFTKMNNSRVQDSKNALEYSFNDDPTFYPDIELVGKKNISARIFGYTKEGFLQPKMKIQSTMDNEFDMGDLVKFIDGNWLCTMKHNYHNVHYKGEIILCNYMLRFQLPNSYDIHEYYVVAERPYSQNLNFDTMVQLSRTEYRVRMQLTDVTKQIHLKQRFIMGYGSDKEGVLIPDVYTVDSRDGTANAIMMEDGFLVLNFMKAAYNPLKDNADEMIADYKEPPAVPDSPVNLCNIIDEDDDFKINLGGGRWREFGCNVYDDEGNIISDLTDIDFTWDVIADSIQSKYIEYENIAKNILRVRCKMPYDNSEFKELMGSDFMVSVEASSLSTTYTGDTKTITIVSSI